VRHRPISDLLDPIMADPERRARIEAIKRAMDDVIALSKLRAERGLTQQEVAETLGVSQANISQIERREDLYLSTLREYVAAIGGELEVRAIFPEGAVTLVGKE
jgi:DNA-binding XRE family transcriptional regulator